MRRALPIAATLAAGIVGWLLVVQSREPGSVSLPADLREHRDSSRSRRLTVPASTPRAPSTNSIADGPESPGPVESKSPASSPRPIVVTGRVLDHVGALEETPANGARVTSRPRHVEWRVPVLTDEEGRFRLEILDPGKRPLKVRVKCHGDDLMRWVRATVEVTGGELEARDVLLERVPHGDLHGVTVDPEGRPVPEVRIVIVEGEREVRSDQEGRFHLSSVKWFWEYYAEREGYMLVDRPRPRADSEGGWEPLRIVLSPAGRMSVVVRDTGGKPVPGVEVQVEVPFTERFGRRRDYSTFSRIDSLEETGEDGVASFRSIWVQQRIEISLRLEGTITDTSRLRSEREEGGMLVLDGTRRGRPIVVTPGADLTLRAVIPPPVRIRGRVEDEAGKPLPGTWVTVSSVEDSSGLEAFTYQTLSDSEGRFSLALLSDRPLDRLLISGTEDSSLHRRLEDRMVGRILIDARADAAEPIVLVLRPPLPIRGRVVASNGNPARASISIHPSGEPIAVANAHSSKNGKFKARGLSPGRYDLHAVPGNPHVETWVRGVEAGGPRVTIPLPAVRTTRVTIEVALRHGEADRLIVLKGRRPGPGNPLAGGAPTLPTVAEFTKPLGWPSQVSWLSGAEETMKKNPTTFELAEGPCWLGAKGRDRDGNHLFPIGTGLVRVGPGEHHLRFELVPAFPLEGRVHAPDVLDLAVAIATDDGELLHLDVGAPDLRPLRELGADGYFRFALVPLGTHELRVATPDELLAGGSRHREALVVGRDGVPFLDVGGGR